MHNPEKCGDMHAAVEPLLAGENAGGRVRPGCGAVMGISGVAGVALFG